MLSLLLECFMPAWQFSVASQICEQHIKLPIVIWGKFNHNNPGKQIKAQFMEMVKEVMFDPSLA
jgi:hypothetical protein